MRLFIIFRVLLWSQLVSRAATLVVRNSTGAQKQVLEDAAKKRLDAKLLGCMANKRIVFIGPSTTKEDYLTTAYFAEYGVWPSEEIVGYGQGQWGPNPMNERGWKQSSMILPLQVTMPVSQPGCVNQGAEWEALFRYSNYLFNGHEACDCYRFGQWAGAHDMYNSTENRIYINPKTNTMVSYFQWWGDVVAPRGTFDITPLLRQPATVPLQQCPVGQFPGRWTWSFSLKDFLAQVVRYAQPTHVVVSASFWPITPQLYQFWDDVAKAGIESVMDTGGQVLWKSTPQRSDSGKGLYATPRVDMTSFTQKGWKIFQAQQVVAQYQGTAPNDAVFYDFAHLRPQAECHLMQTFLHTHVCNS